MLRRLRAWADHGSMFVGDAPQNAARAAFANRIAANREPADVAPVNLVPFHGSSAPVQHFTMPVRANRGDVVDASARNVPPALNAASRPRRVV